ncbi:MAG: helix-turn-helix domain-containing protein [Patescibacteria group bacterium]|jgi:sugar-specific transcriptional regulator TrmB
MPKISSPIAKTLVQIGLTEKEAAVYEALLELGKAGMGGLLKKIPYKRGNAYDLVKALIDKGLVTETVIKGKKVFVIEPPERIKVLLDEREKTVQQQAKTLNANYESLNSLYRITMNKPGVRYFEGKEGIIKIYEELLANNQPIDSIEDKGDLVESIPDYAATYVKKRVQKRIPNRVISPDTNTLNQSNPEKLLEARLVPADQFPFRMDIKISGNKVSLITFPEKNIVGVLIDNQEIAENFHILFEFLWTKLATQN